MSSLTGPNLSKCESSFKKILCIITTEIALWPFDPEMKTIIVTDAGLVGVVASEASTWIPANHASCCLTPCEQAYAQIEKESLAQAWGVNIHWYYLYAYCLTPTQTTSPSSPYTVPSTSLVQSRIPPPHS